MPFAPCFKALVVKIFTDGELPASWSVKCKAKYPALNCYLKFPRSKNVYPRSHWNGVWSKPQEEETGQTKSRSYPNGLTVAYEYNPQGYAQRIKNAASGYVYRDITAQDAFGHITEASLGNGVVESRSYDAGTGWVQALSARLGSVAVHQLSYSEYDSFGNLKYYSNNATNVSESYGYDDVL